jgi:gas vesicle protein
MIARMRTAMKFFVYGLAIGILFAPRSGKESRSALLDWVNRTVKETFGL